MTLLEHIQNAFAHRQAPNVLSDSRELTEDEQEEVVFFSGRNWSAISIADWEKFHEALYWFSPGAFCFYLPGIYCSTVESERPSLLVNFTLIQMLDRSPNPDWWDEFFVARWGRLTKEECAVSQEWILWLTSCPDNPFSDESLSRAFQTLELLSQAKGSHLAI